ncbi:SGNH/GDSL hydrolase family protein [Dyadobacter sp. CY261]|uniref:SGNH/GDSL hydrolase family protein n=1 Tax=Dyadobacter sp. CY261 TaxID=2907203 RepID=UPI001F282E88|nr:SGNH/GDSL hydrolase family protein [Dyadobacter sp. CY261]MCF0070783.1 SGNH/GDSL hydrolase family protein [Dyadobacter sp. CY261]
MKAFIVPSRDSYVFSKTRIRQFVIYLSIFLLLWVGSGSISLAQFQRPDVSLPSPNAASLGLYGEVPVSLYTGMPNVTIPLYTLQEGKINVPITLSYHASGVRVNQHPGWVGSNWNLNAGGAITRKMKGILDEFNDKGVSGYYHSHGVLNQLNWETPEYTKQIVAAATDTDPDEFNFNFMGISGSFYQNAKGDWVARSNSKIKITVDPNFMDVPNSLQATCDGSVGVLISTTTTGNNPKTFGKFTLTTVDGTRYVFGGTTDAIEYSTSFFNGPGFAQNYKVKDIWVANTWYLTQIITPQGQQVTFNYSANACSDGKFVASFYNSHTAGSYNSSSGTSGVISMEIKCGGSSIGSTSGYVAGVLTRPVYLDGITGDQHSITFTRSSTNELKYETRILKPYFDQPGGNLQNVPTDIFPYLNYNGVLGSVSSGPDQRIGALLNKLVWKQLDQIKVANKDGSIVNNIKFGYSSDTTKRLTLNNVKYLSNSDENCLSKYDFEYYTDYALPKYLDALDKTDHWGFFNGLEYDISTLPATGFSTYEAKKASSTNIQILRSGSLKKVTYPTGGYTEFDFEKHTSKKYQSINKDASITLVTDATQALGGLRIKTITSKETSNAVLSTKQYEYLLADGSSSGISSGKPVYGSGAYKISVCNAEGSITQDIYSLQNLLPTSTNSHGTHIGYSRVVEKNSDNSYKVYTYTNYESPDGSFHMDLPVPNTLRIQGSDASRYEPFYDKSFERGLLLSEESYDASNKPVLKKINTYKALSNDFVEGMYRNSVAVCPGSGRYGCSGFPYRIYTYQYKLDKEQVFNYTQGQTESTEDKTEYISYNSIGLPVETKTTRNSKTTVTKDRYSIDYVVVPGSVLLDEPSKAIRIMQANNMGGLLVERQIWNNDNGTLGIADGFLNLYRSYPAASGFINIQPEKTLQYSVTAAKTIVVNSSIRANGSSFSFNYDSDYKKVVVKFDDPANAYTLRGEPVKFTDNDNLTTTLTYYGGSKTGLLASKTIGNQTTTYDYKPLVGITSIKDPASFNTFYAYDGFNRLVTVKDHWNNLLQSNSYNLINSSGCSTPKLVSEPIVTPTLSGSGKYSRVVIIGNSITKLVAQTGSDGWQSPALTAAGGWGRASSTQAKDFAHILEARFKQLDANAQVLPLWEAPFERDYISSPAGWVTYDFTALQNRIKNSFGSSSWKPDLVIIRLGENVLNSEVELNNFKGAYNTLIDKVLAVSAPGAKVILTNSMWPDQPLADAKIQQVATERGLPFVSLSDMISNPVYLAGNDPVSMAAFPNNTGDRHPGDAGMLEIADRIWSKVKNVDLPSNIGGNITKVRIYPRSETCCIARIAGSVIQGSNDMSNPNGWTTLATITETPVAGWNEYTIRTTTAWRYVRFLAGANCYGDIKELEFYNGNVKLNGSRFGSSTAYNNDPATYGYNMVFDGQLTNVWSGNAAGPQNYAGLDLGAGCSALTASVTSPANNASVVGTASTTTTGRVTTAISVTTCVPTGTTISSVEIWATTSSGGFPNRMGYAIADASQPGVYKLSSDEGSAAGKWPTPFLDPGTYRFYAKINTAGTTLTTDYITVTLTAPPITGCPSLTASMLSPANNASVVGTASTVTAGRVITAISVNTCVPTGTTITGVEIWASTTSDTFHNLMGKAIADGSQPGVYKLSAQEGSADGKWSAALLDPGTYRFYAKVKTATTTVTTNYNTITLTAPPTTGNITKVRLYNRSETCCISRIAGSVIQGSNDMSNANGWTTLVTIGGTPVAGWNEYAIQTTTNWRYVRFLADSDCYGDIKELEFYNGSVKLNGSRFGSSTAYNNDPTNYGYNVVFDGLLTNTWSGTAAGPQNYAGLDLGAGCSTLTASMLSPANNASVVGTASTVTAGRVITAISVTTCVPTGTTITSVEIWASTTSDTFHNLMGYAVADASQPGVYKLSAEEGSANGKWPAALLDPGTYRFYAKVKTATATVTTNYNTITLTAPPVTGCPSLTGSVISPANNASVVGTASTTTAGRVITAISVTACAPTGSTITSVEVWATTSTGTFPNRMGYAIADASQPGIYKLAAEEGSANGKWPAALLDPGTYRFYAKVNTATNTFTTNYITVTLTAPPVTGCPTLTGNVISPANNASVVGTPSTTTAGRVITAISVSTCAPTGSTITGVEIWATTSTGGFPNRMGYAIADGSQPGVYKLSAEEGSANGKWPTALLDPGTYRFYAKVNTATTTFETNYITVTLTAPVTGCAALTASVLSPANNASVVGTASTITAGRVITAISVTACVPTGSAITSVEIWASTTSDTFHNMMGYAIADGSQPGVYKLSAQEGSAAGKWPTPFLNPGTYRFYAKVKTASTTFTTAYNTITLTAP